MKDYRSYKNAEEFLQAWKEHGPFFKIRKYDDKNPGGYCSVSAFFDHRVSFFVTDVDEKRREFKVNAVGLSYDEFLDNAIWSDGTPCGVKEENEKTSFEVINKALKQLNSSNVLYTIEDVRYDKPYYNTACYLINSEGNVNLGCFANGIFNVCHFSRGEGANMYYTPATDVVAYVPYDV